VLDGGEWSASRPGRALPQGKDPRYPLYRRLGGPQSRSGHRGSRKNPLPLPGIEPRSPGRPVRSQTIYWLNYSGTCLLNVTPPFSKSHQFWKRSPNNYSHGILGLLDCTGSRRFTRRPIVSYSGAHSSRSAQHVAGHHGGHMGYSPHQMMNSMEHMHKATNLRAGS
jgi:hypothetical protein